jgi:hypothetical protein
MSLGVCECEEHLEGVPVETGSLGLDVGCENEAKESSEITRYVAPHPSMCSTKLQLGGW